MWGAAMKRREFAKRAVAAAVAPIALGDWREKPTQAQDTPAKQENAPASRAEELKKRAEGQREQMSAALRKRPLPYDLEPAFVFAAKPRERMKPGSKEFRK